MKIYKWAGIWFLIHIGALTLPVSYAQDGFTHHELAIRLIGEYPDDDPDWSDNLQGVTHDCCNWFFTQTEEIWKIPVGVALREATDGENNVFYKDFDDYTELHSWGYNHFGDPCYYEHNGTGFLIVPVEDNDSPPSCGRLAFFNPENLIYIDSYCIDNGNNRASWCAVDTAGVIYSSIDRDVTHINRFHVDWDRLVNQDEARIEPADPPSIALRDESGNYTILEGSSLQGGTITPSNELLYLIHGNGSDIEPGNGIHVFDLATGRRVARSSRDSGIFRFLWDPGGLEYEEPEGMTFWDLDNEVAPGISGQVHVILIEEDILGHEHIWFKHYTNVTYVSEAAGQQQDGSVFYPFRSVSQAAAIAWDGSKIRINAGSYPEAVTISNKILLEAKGGSVVIGK